LFKGHPHLLLGFSNFLPDGCKLRLPLDYDHQQGYQLAIEDEFLNQVKLGKSILSFYKSSRITRLKELMQEASRQ
jgi:hypothetical protein